MRFIPRRVDTHPVRIVQIQGHFKQAKGNLEMIAANVTLIRVLQRSLFRKQIDTKKDNNCKASKLPPKSGQQNEKNECHFKMAKLFCSANDAY